MKKYLSHFILSVVSFIALASPLTSVASAAGSATLSFTSSANSVVVGSGVSVQIFENGTGVNVVTVHVTYDASKLSCSGVDTATSAFANGISATCGGGSATISRYTAPGTTLNGSMKVATLNFTATAQGAASMSFGASSQIASTGVNIWNGASATKSITITTPVVVPPAPTPTPSPTPTPTPTPTPSPASSTQTSTAAPTTSQTATANRPTNSAAPVSQQQSETQVTTNTETATAAQQEQVVQPETPTAVEQGDVLGATSKESNNVAAKILTTIGVLAFTASAGYLYARFKTKSAK